MADEIEKDTQQEDSNMYLEQIKELKANTVSKDEFNRLKEENRNLLKTIVEGSQADTTVEDTKPSRALDEILKDFNNEDSTNLNHIEAVLELHEKRLEQGYNDFVPMGHEIQPTDEDIKDAKDVYDFLKDLVNTAQGDPVVFNNEYQRRVKDIMLPKRK